MNEQFEKRIKQYATCKAVDLTKDEIDQHYHGCGGSFVAVNTAGEVTAIWYTANHIYDGDDFDVVLKRARDFTNSRTGETVYHGLMSCHQFCEVVEVDLSDDDQHLLDHIQMFV